MLMAPLGIMAQSSMTDNQVMEFVMKEHEAGTSQAQICLLYTSDAADER